MFLTGKDFWLQYGVLIIAIAILVITQLPPVKRVFLSQKSEDPFCLLLCW